MDRLHCSDLELASMDAGEIEIYIGFMSGEQEGLEQKRRLMEGEAKAKGGR